MTPYYVVASVILVAVLAIARFRRAPKIDAVSETWLARLRAVDGL
jgi:hypothetical protein